MFDESLSEDFYYHLLAVLFLFISIFTANVISWRVSHEGFDCRNLVQTLYYVQWLVSYGLGLAVSTLCTDRRFTYMWVKDSFFAAATYTLMMLVQFGILNRCSCATAWGRKGVILPQLPGFTKILNDRIAHEWLGVTLGAIAVVGCMCIGVCAWHMDAVRVFLLRDDSNTKSFVLNRRHANVEEPEALELQ
jgi:hypothetical protein